MYDPSSEHDACGVGMVTTLNGKPERKIVDDAIEVLVNLNHRGAVGAEENTGDGAGILMAMPDEFMRATIDADLPEVGHYAAGIAFLDRDIAASGRQEQAIATIAKEEGLDVLAWRTVPTDPNGLGLQALASMPAFKTLVLADPEGHLAGIELDRRVYHVRKRAEHEVGVYFASLSSRTITYKGMLTTMQLKPFFPDLSDERMKTTVATVHSRFSTNTFPSWPLAQPFRMLAHNGEINTIQGNRNWFTARQGRLKSDLLGDMADLLPILTPGYSDSGTFDEVLELLNLAGRSLPHAILMMVPPAWEKNTALDPDVRAFYEYNNTLIEPWDGPADLVFTDGSLVGALLDRNGFRPGRWQIDDEGYVVLASEAGVLPQVGDEHIVSKGRLEPGRMFLIDIEQGRMVPDEEIKHDLATQHPYREWVEGNTVSMADLPAREHVSHSNQSVHRRQRAFGYTQEELKMVLLPMANTGKEPLGSMGNDTPMSVLSGRSRMLFDYFTQKFAQVTNPPLDWEREKIVTSVESAIGPEPNLLDDCALHAKKILIEQPVITSDEMAQLKRLDRASQLDGYYRPYTVKGLYQVTGGGDALRERLDEIFAEIDAAIEDGKNFLILSDRDSNHMMAPIPSLLLTSAVQHHLLRRQTRTQISMVVEAGDVREIHHVALLIAYGAAAVNPYLAFESVEDLAHDGFLTVDEGKAIVNLRNALSTGVLKIMSKMGVSTIMSYRGAQLFEAVGLDDAVIDDYFTGTVSRVAGCSLDDLAEEVAIRHRVAYPNQWTATPHRNLRTGGDYKWRRTGEEHLNDPEAIFLLQQSTQRGDYAMFKQYTHHIDDTSHRLMTLRGLMKFDSPREPISIDEVEPATEIVKRFSTGAMSYGSISKEAHETLAIAMNSIGARSNSGEGGESTERLNDPLLCSKIKQIASARFGVTSDYLVHATDLQIKLAQGAKPGEGGHLPGAKVPPWIAKVRHATPGVELISPPPHHDIYSIEDLKQLINDAKMANPKARIHVKLVSEFGVGTIAAGVAKCHADVVLISGYDGGTGAAPLNAIRHAGTPWEIGLSETQQTLVLNGLRSRVTVQCDGELKTGRDVVIAALLGAEEFGFATTALMVEGCVMMRACQKNTCPQGIATQDPELRARFTGKPEHVINFMMFIAEEVREILAQLGFRTLEEAVGHVECLDQNEAVRRWKSEGIDLSNVLMQPGPVPGTILHKTIEQNHELDKALDNELIAQAQPALEHGERVSITMDIRNVNRTLGTMLGYEITRRYGGEGLPDDTIDMTFTGTGGQSIGAFIPRGETIRVVGEVNDYAGKGLSGGRIVISAPTDVTYDAHENVIAGNVLGFGATTGEMFVAGRAGERFGVRNGGATFVVEGVGDHGCEYMTGGTVVILGPTGRNLGAGFSGGHVFVLDLDMGKVNPESAAGALRFAPLDETSEPVVRALVERHAQETGSGFAQSLLDDWDNAKTRFTHMVPKQFVAMTHAMEEAKREHIDFNEPGVWEQTYEHVMEGAR
ncbi:glutamate synthase large subunit [Bifidobacterium pseudolongum]|uniref:glutamate synthase large subunit n=1 Tax=Bifidobacterium pseudolongum TaxID=1694 RepID=UPI000C7068A8|nr:glutamate synthase large subunit [Bifidobacterium pseudolongum]PKV08026.1 glutamate synthase [Bifidobacterium pseudolongum subsp. pseudolongum]RYQ52637.1 glutamate synthase [Bifidobacterium pseudolongum subsp. pseudolongum]UBY95022.1 glutamate synthase large subunit [Bifidobacterium pseudolongum]UBZ03856.1 glutamate synthase large subunit [Bifidobacterium pseudolongum]UDL24442.1 glutamate synthase large subunit [Bifidobacterium pseudolongum]